MKNCSKCPDVSDLNCPACDSSFCISCFVDHGKTCYEQSKRKTEQGEEKKKCSVCGRYASINPVVHCSDCQIEICRSCLYAHRKEHEAERKKKCVTCGALPHADFEPCGTCSLPVCPACQEAHQNTHKTGCAHCHKQVYRDITSVCSGCGQRICVSCMPEHKKKEHPKYRCSACGIGTSTECDECRKPYCKNCFVAHEWIHGKRQGEKFYCSGCHREYAEKIGHCEHCGYYFCDMCKLHHMVTCPKNNSYSRASYTINEDPTYSARREYGSGHINKEDLDELLKKMFGDAGQRRYYDFGSFTDNDDSYTFRQHYTGQQQSSHSQQSQQKTRTQAPSQELEKAFALLNLSQRATVQEVKRAFRRKAKEAHPDTGGSEEAFKKVNAAYQMALAHAERNER